MKKRDIISSKPVKINSNSESFKKFIRKHPELVAIDEYKNQLEELLELRNPRFKFQRHTKKDFEDFVSKLIREKDLKHHGHWFYFPWSNQLIHYLPEDLHYELRTARNKFLITNEEQRKYYNSTIGIFGMSVGSHVALTIAMTGGAKNIKLADLDAISGSNLNRIRAGFGQLGVNKAISVARQIIEINPYANIKLYSKGVSDKNIDEIILGNPKSDLIIEEMDNPYFKLKTRYIARENKIPVIMAADNGDGIIADIERYDIDKNPPILHGILGGMSPRDVKNIEPKKLPSIIAKIAGADKAHLRMLESVLQVGKTIYSWPQLGTAATMCGTVLTYLARNIIIKNPKFKSGRYDLNPDQIFEYEHHLPANAQKRDKERKKLLRMFGS